MLGYNAAMNDTDFDPDVAIADYRHVITQRDQATTAAKRMEFDGISRRLRVAWKNWQGEDCLHEKAFREPPPAP